MELGEGRREREPVTFDISQLPEGWAERENGVARAFDFDIVRFDDDLQTAVAKSKGINDAGELDMDMLGAVEATAAYLQDRQGQTVLIINTITDVNDESIQYLTGYIGTLSDSPNLVGVHEQSRGNKEAGIAVRNYAWFHSYLRDGQLGTQYLQPRKGSTIPLSNREFTLGHPEAEIREGTTGHQEVVSGADIVPWILENYGGDENGYHLYMNIVRSVSREEGFEFKQLEPLLVEPFIGTAREELTLLHELERILRTYQFKSENMRKVLDGVKAEANLALNALATGSPHLCGRLPSTSTSYRTGVASSLDDPYGEQVGERLDAIDYSKDPLTKLVREAMRRGKI